MTLNAGNARNEYTASASQTVFNYTFKIYESTDLDVYVTAAGQECSDADLTTSYTVSGVGAEAGGTITLTTPANSGDLVTIVSSIATSRTTDYQNNGDFRPDTVNDDFDRNYSLVKQIEDVANRSLQFAPCLQNASALTLPSPESGQFLRWKGDLSGVENYPFSSGSAVAHATEISTTINSLPRTNLETYLENQQVPDYATLIANAAQYADGDVVNVTDDGIQGRGVVRESVAHGLTDDGHNIIVLSVDKYWFRVDRTLSALQFGAQVDYTAANVTANTDAVKACIDAAYKLGGVDVIIPDGVAWSEQTLQQGLTGTVTVNSADTISGISTAGEDYVGCFLWNLTDFSYGTVISQTATSITVRKLSLGTTDTFTIGDDYIVSFCKVGVNIIDQSRWSEHNGKFTGQHKTFLNMDDPLTGSANEQWAWGQYHPAFVVSNHNPSDMEKRASFLARTYNGQNKIQGFFQLAINPLNNTDSTNDPGAASDVLLAMGHNQGVAANNASSLIAEGWRASDDMNGLYHAIGTRAQTGISHYQKQTRNETNKIVHDAAGTQRTEHHYYNAGVDGGRYIIHWNAFNGGFTGMCSLVVPRTSSLTVDETLYCGAVYTNEGAAGNVTVSLPSTCPIGYEQSLVVDTAQFLTIQILGGATLYNGDTTRRSNTVGDRLKVKKITSTNWAIMDEEGTWAT